MSALSICLFTVQLGSSALSFFTRRNSLRPSCSLSFLGRPPIPFLQNFCVLRSPTGSLHKRYMCVFETFASFCNALMDVFFLNLTYAMVPADKNFLPAILLCYFTICLLQPLVTSFDVRFILNAAGVKRRSCRSTQVSKMQVKSCGSKVAAMGILAVGFLPFAQEWCRKFDFKACRNVTFSHPQITTLTSTSPSI